MQPAPLPRNESDRLEALRRYDILDTEAEELFDSIAQIAATICDAPIALITLIDLDRQWFKAKVGLDISETARDYAFCSHTILQPDEMLIVPDATLDDRFRDNPFVTGAPDIRFYAGAPIVTPDRHALGSLCVIDRQPRALNDRQIQALRHLSQQVCANLELRLKTKKLQLLNESKNRFFSILSHDLRSPLHSILSIADLLTDPEMDFTADESAEFLQHLRTNASTTVQIAENLLRMTQFEKGTFSFAPESLGLATVIEGAQQAVAGKLAAKSIAIAVDCPSSVRVWADRAMLHSILQNLCSNAVKFTPPKGAIRIASAIEGGVCLLSVQDTGVGIKPDVLARIFELDSCYSSAGTDGEKGSGLGLTLCQQFAEKLGGSLALTSEPGHGTTATLRLPLAPDHGR